MMSGSLLVLLLVGCGVVLAEEEAYSSKYDNVDVDAILSNERLSNQYAACILGDGRCSPDGRAFKKILPDALSTSCSKCNDRQKLIIRKILNHTMKNHPDLWDEFTKVYDPENKYKISIAKFLHEE